MTEFSISRIYNITPKLTVKVEISSLEGRTVGMIGHTGGRMQITESIPKAIEIRFHDVNRTVFGIPDSIYKILVSTSRGIGQAVCYPSRSSPACTISNKTLTQEQAVATLEKLDTIFKQWALEN